MDEREILQVEPLQLLLQKSGDYIENFGFGSGYNLLLKQKLLELIMKYCKNIKFFDFHGFENQIVYLGISLIENIRQNLNCLSINACKTSQLLNINIENIERSSIVLQNLGQILPSKLEYLSLTLNIKASDFEVFLKNSQNTFVEKLVINNRNGEDILSNIKEYIMKKKRVKYLAIKNTTGVKNLFSLKDEVKEFKLHSIRVQHYDDLCIYVDEFIKEID